MGGRGCFVGEGDRVSKMSISVDSGWEFSGKDFWSWTVSWLVGELGFDSDVKPEKGLTLILILF